MVHPLIIHVLEVIDRSLICIDLPHQYIDQDEDTTRRHVYPCWGGRVDGSSLGVARG